MSGTPGVEVPPAERRSGVRTDRRARSRSGRRAGDPRGNWRRVAWLFAAYAGYLSLRSLPSAVRRLFSRKKAPTA